MKIDTIVAVSHTLRRIRGFWNFQKFHKKWNFKNYKTVYSTHFLFLHNAKLDPERGKTNRNLLNVRFLVRFYLVFFSLQTIFLAKFNKRKILQNTI